jgi:PAS domain S-box-containing protein
MSDDLEDLFENAPCGYLSINPNGRIDRANSTFLRWLSYAPGDVAGKRFQDFLNIAGRIYYETHFAPLLRMQGAFNEVALDLVGGNGKVVPVLVNAVERRDASGALLFTRITIFNATDRRRYEQELLGARKVAEEANAQLRELNATLEARVAAEVKDRLEAEENLRQAQKMEAIGHLTGGVAHDFNNLLTIVIGGLDAIERQLPNIGESPAAARIRRSRDMALNGARRAATLTSRLLAFSRRQPLAPEMLDINRLVVGLAEMLQRTLGETISLETVSGAGLWPALADRSELENALVNLAVNARDAMDKSGRLTIETANAYLDEDYISTIPEPIKPGRYVQIAVSDTGVGMTQEVMSKAFDPFFTTKEVGKGTGLGLSQVHGFVRQSDGHVRIYSELGHGTTVKLYLPEAATAVVSTAVFERVPERIAGGTETVLVVEDDDVLRDFSGAALVELGYGVLCAKSGPGALKMLREQSVDLLFTDVVLPDGMNGRQLAEEARRWRPDLKVLYTTGYTRNAIVHQGRLDPDIEFIGKPSPLTTLRGACAPYSTLIRS